RGTPRPLPSRKPLVRNLLGDPAGRVWLEVYAKAEERAPTPRRPGDSRPQLTLRDATTYEVFAADGTYLGRIALPPESQVLGITPTRLWVFQRGPDDEERVAAYALPPRWATTAAYVSDRSPNADTATSTRYIASPYTQ